MGEAKKSSCPQPNFAIYLHALVIVDFYPRGTVCRRIFNVLTLQPPSRITLELITHLCLHLLSSLNCFLNYFILFYFHCSV